MRNYRATSALLAALVFLARSSLTIAQCELHEVAKLTASDGAGDDYFGVSVSVSGDVAIVGSYSDDCPTGLGTNCGSAYMYRFNGSSWVQHAKLTASDAAQVDVFGGGSNFGYSVSVHGDLAIVGAFRDECAAGILCGSAYVYRFDGSSWVEEQKLRASDAAAFDGFGYSVSVSGDVAVVGAVNDDCGLGGIGCGSAYVFRFNGSTWVQQAKLTAADRAANDFFGRFVSVSGDTAVVGADGDDCSTGPDTNCGSAYVYRFNGSSWIQQAKLTASDAAQQDYYGKAVSVSGNLVVVGSYGDDCPTGPGTSCGSAYIYRFDGSTWAQEAKLTASDAALGDQFGSSVSVSGETTVVGAYWDNCAPGFACGSAYVYRFNPGAPGQWLEEEKLTASDAAPGDNFGVSVSVSGDVAVVGAYLDDCCGSAYVFALEALTSPSDCNGNNLPDECESPADCNGNSVQDICDVAAGTSDDCNVNDVPDECESQTDCNNNGTQDICDVFAGTSPDCNGNEVPDECELGPNDCNGNGIPDDCESEVDCNGNGLLDFCELFDGTSADCNANSVLDECDIASGSSTDANANGIPDECDTNLPPFIIEQPVDQSACKGGTVAFTVQAGGMTPFTYQWHQDTVDLDGETADTLTLAGVNLADFGDYDVVVTNSLGSATSNTATLALVSAAQLEIDPDPSGIPKNRYLSFILIPSNVSCTVAVRVKMVDLQHPDPRNLPQYPPSNFSAFDTSTHGTCAGATTSPNYNGHHCATDPECLGPNNDITTDDGTCGIGPACTAVGEGNGCARWVGKPGTFYEAQGPPAGGPYRAARLQCTPLYWDWITETATGPITVVGAEIVPSSEYSVQAYGASCEDTEATCTNVSAPVTMFTGRKGDLDSPFQSPSPAPLTQADVLDVSQAIAAVKHQLGAPSHARAQMQPNLPELNKDLNVLDIVEAVDSVKRLPYSFSGPCVCPSTVTCGASCTGCPGLCVKTCTGGENDGEPCINNSHCPGVCVGGPTPGVLCPSSVAGGINCGMDGTCTGACAAVGTCRDKCGRCTPWSGKLEIGN